jgi:hypothetical protein
MHVSKSIETAQGSVTFEGELSAEELDFVLKIGLNSLLKMGAIPFTTVQKESEIAVPETALKQ